MNNTQTNNDDVVIKDRLVELYDLLKQIQEKHSDNEQNITDVHKARDKCQGDTPTKPYQKSKMRSLYKNAIQNNETESKFLRDALVAVVDIRQTLRQRQRKLISAAAGQQTGVRRGALMKILHQSASALPLYIPDKIDESAPPLCGCIPADLSYIAKPGDLVAAFVPSPDGDGSKVWVLGEVLQYITGSGKYEIDDIDEEQKERHLIGKRRVIPLPVMRANPLTNSEALFPKNTIVLALYPQTTCFYRAMIDRPPQSPSHDYMVSFEDATYTEGFSPPLAVPQRYVISSRDPRN